MQTPTRRSGGYRRRSSIPGARSSGRRGAGWPAGTPGCCARTFPGSSGSRHRQPHRRLPARLGRPGLRRFECDAVEPAGVVEHGRQPPRGDVGSRSFSTTWSASQRLTERGDRPLASRGADHVAPGAELARAARQSPRGRRCWHSQFGGCSRSTEVSCYEDGPMWQAVTHL